MVCFALLWSVRPAHLVVGAVLLLALAALQQVSGGAASFGHLVLPDGLLRENVPQLLQLITGHFLHEDKEVDICSRGANVRYSEGGTGERSSSSGWHAAAAVPTSADMEAMRLSSMLPARTFLRSPGFFGSFKLLMRLRTLFLYFISVAFISW